ncbi:MAG: hypothetical protein K0R36_593 [Chryseobacterium sp.]|jgi:hypothetical protein|nr:hypothetical protein [Chryseobacterium sp.]
MKTKAKKKIEKGIFEGFSKDFKDFVLLCVKETKEEISLQNNIR